MQKVTEDSIITRIRTTMIGSISAIEQSFEKELENEDFYQKFVILRKNILDLGNKQIRLLKEQLNEETN